MTSKTRIAVLVAALFLGARAGIAALDQTPAADATAETAQVTQELQSAEPAETGPAATEAAETVAAVAERPAAAVAPFVPFRAARGEEPWEILPKMAAYLDQRAIEQSRLVARGDAFPRSEETAPMLPVMAAYLEQREAAMISRAATQTVATAPAAGASN